MPYLFVDTTEVLCVGVLSETFEWLSFIRLDEKKTSSYLHPMINKVLEDANVSIKELSRILHVAGPGSYTGMRLSHGVAQVFDWYEIPINSVYHFEVPKLLGVSNGHWVSKAYKKELFIYSWDGEAVRTKLLPEIDFIIEFRDLDHEDHEKYYSHFPDMLDTELTVFNSTHLLMRNRASELFTKVIELDLVREPYYYRTIDQEFNKPNV